MANPLALFRKYEKILLVVFGVALMIVFTVGGIVSQYMNRGAAASENSVVATVGSEEFRESDLQNLRYARYHLVNFLRAVNQEAMLRGAQPRQNLGIPTTDGEANLVQTAIFAKQAQDLGIEYSDDAIISTLIRYSNGKLQSGDFARILNNVTQRRMSQSQFFDAMRREMLAQQYLGLLQEGMMPPTPAGIWDYFLRLNRRISFEAVPFPVSDYLAQVEEPTEAEIAAMYEEGKNRYSLPSLPTPGFKEPKKVAVEYVKADLEAFLADAKAQISDAQIQEYYDAHPDEFRNLELPTFDDPSDLDFPFESTEGVEGSEATVPPSVPQPSDESTSSADDAPPGNEPNGGPAPTDTEPPLPDAPDANQDAVEAPNVEDQRAEPELELELDATPSEPSGTDQTARNATTFNVAALAQEREDVEAEAATDDDQGTVDSRPEDAGNDPSTTEDTPSPARDPNGADATVDAPETLTTESDDLTQEDPLAGLPDQAGNNTDDEELPEIKPLEEVSETIRTRLATPIARQKMDAALGVVRAEMKTFFGTYLAWEVSPDREDQPKPTPPDLQPLAQRHGLNYGTVPLVTVIQLQETDPITGDPLYEISRAYDSSGVLFPRYMFAEDLRMYEVRSIRGSVLDTEYLYWKTDEVGERVPTLDEARHEVVRALKMKRALELAKQAAQQAADKLNQSHQLPRDLYANDPDRKVIQANSVSWMTSPGLANSQPYLTPIQGIRYAGHEFMQAAFSLSPGQAGIAVNQPEDTVFVVAVTELNSDEAALREQFLQSGTTMETALLARSDSERHLQQWFDQLQDRLGLHWNRDPAPDSQNR